MPVSASPSKVYHRVLEEIFSGRIAPGSKLVEQKLADQLGVSRVPIRETLVKLVGQGVLVGGKKGHGVHVREYTTAQVRELYEFRKAIEGGAARAAAKAANDDDFLAMEMVCERMDQTADAYFSPCWADLDHRFHEAIATASHNQRFIQEMKTLLRECHYIFFGSDLAKRAWLDLSKEEVQATHAQVMNDHRQLLAAIKQRDMDQAGLVARRHMSNSADRITQASIAHGLKVQQADEPFSSMGHSTDEL